MRRVLVTAALTALAAPLLAMIAPVAGEATPIEPGVFRVVGELPAPKGALPNPSYPSSIVAVDRVGRRLFYRYTDGDLIDHLVTYDIRSRIPRQTATGVLGSSDREFAAEETPYNVAYDSKRQQLAFLVPSIDPVPAGTYFWSVVIYSTRTNTRVLKRNIQTIVPGYVPLGIAYSEKDDLYYTLGEFTANHVNGDGTTQGGGKIVSPGNGVVAFNPADFGLAWLRSVAECPQILYSKGIGSFVARSSDQDALYFACVNGGSAAATTHPTESGLVRLHIAPHGTSADQLQQPVEFFPISGSYYAGGSHSGVAAFDPRTERFYLQSMSIKTPGAWVFDGRLTAWVGFVSAPSNADAFIGLNEGLGHLYIGTWRGSSKPEPTDGLLAADVRQTPVPAGDFRPIVPGALIATDPGSNRLFVNPYDKSSTYLIVEDLTDVSKGALLEEDPDLDTAALPDVAANDVNYAGGATGFGAEAVQVGGGTSPETMAGPFEPGLPKALPGTRAAMGGRTGYIDLRPSGASAGAQAFVVDSNTLHDYETSDQDNNGQRDFGNWPYPALTCNNVSGQADTQTAKGYTDKNAQFAPGQSVPDDDKATVTCDAAGNTTLADATVAATSTGGVDVGRASHRATAARTTKDGMTVTTTAEARGISYSVAGGFRVTLGRVTATAVSVAHGRPGTSRSTYTRAVEGVRIDMGTGTQALYAGPGCTTSITVANGGKALQTDTCAALADVVNKVLPERFHIAFPMPAVIATPKGAFAGVEQGPADYYQQSVVNDQGVVYKDDSVGVRPTPAVVAEVYTDMAERSRTVVVLAGTQTNATFTVNPPFGDGGFIDQTQLPGESGGGGREVVTTGAPLGGSGSPQPPGTLPNGTFTSAPVNDLSGYLFLRRGLRDTLLLLLLSGLVLGGFGTTWRRRRLVDVLVTVPGKEAL